jgi:hypothetical protein
MQHGDLLLRQLMADNRALGNLVTVSDKFVASLAADRRQLGTTLDTLSRTTETVAARREALRGSLERAPAALSTARSFLAELRAAVRPLGSTARQLTTAAPLLRTVLDRLPAFERAASPTLGIAADRAPDLTKLGRGAAPVLRRAVPVLASVRGLSTKTLPRVGATLDGSMDNILALLENWSRAIQFSDGLSHIFRGEASFAPDAYLSALKRLSPQKRGSERKTHKPAKAPSLLSPGGRPPALPVPKGPAPAETLDLPAVKTILDAIPKNLLGPGSGDNGRSDPRRLLDYLLGKK